MKSITRPAIFVKLGLLGCCFNLAVAQNGLIPDNPRPTANLSRLGTVPDWNFFDNYQRTMTRDEFLYLLENVYSRYSDEYKKVIEVMPDRALIKRQANFTESGVYNLYFKETPEKPTKPQRYWRTTYELDNLPAGTQKVLTGVKIAIDPGHIGGEWVKWDDRHFKVSKSHVEVREGELTLKVAKILERDLTSLGATVRLTRDSNNPVTELRPDDLKTRARSYLLRKGKVPSEWRIFDTAKSMFAISSEIRTRANFINEDFQPDLAIILHFNAAPWGRTPSFRKANHLHFLVNGCYSDKEMAEDDSRFEMLRRLLERTFYEEVAICREVEKTMVRETGLPPFKGYKTSTGKPVEGSDYAFIRNLLGNRAFQCPNLFLEPYCMNDKEVYYRIQAGEYSGLKEMWGKDRKNIFQEYADGVTSGLVNYFYKRRSIPQPPITAQPIVAPQRTVVSDQETDADSEVAVENDAVENLAAEDIDAG